MGNRDWINEERLGIIEHGVAENRVMINKVQEKLKAVGHAVGDNRRHIMAVEDRVYEAPPRTPESQGRFKIDCKRCGYNDRSHSSVRCPRCGGFNPLT